MPKHTVTKILERNGFRLHVSFDNGCEARWVDLKTLISNHPLLKPLKASDTVQHLAKVESGGLMILGKLLVTGPTIFHLGHDIRSMNAG